MNQIHEIPNYRQIKVKFVPVTNTRGARIKIWETARYNDQKDDVVYKSFDYEIADVQSQAFQYLKEKGFKVVARASEKEYYILLCDNWGSNFINLKGEKSE